MYETHADTYVTLFEKVTPPFYFISKRYQVLCSLQKGISYSMENPKKRKIEDYWHAVVEDLPATCKRGADLHLELLQKAIKYSLEQIACRIANCVQRR
jgi:hypothetical protein